MVKSNRHEAHYRIFCTPLFLPPSHIKYSPHHPALINPQSVFFYWHKTPNFTPTKWQEQWRFYRSVHATFWNEWQQVLLFFCKIVVLLTFCQDLTYLKPDLQQSDSGDSQAMWNKIQTAQDFTIRTAENPFSTVQYFMSTDYQRSQKFWIFVNYEHHWTKWPKLNSGSIFITWSITGLWFSFSATTVTCDILNFKPSHQLSTVRTC